MFESVNIELGVEGGVIAPFCRAVFLGRQGVKGLHRFFGAGRLNNVRMCMSISVDEVNL